jgi:CHASE3 domain sensor protein
MSDVTLREYIEKIMDERFESAERALDISTKVLDLRLEAMNELRDQINNERGRYLTRETFDQSRDQARIDMEKVDKRMRDQENAMSNLQGRMTTMGFAITVGLIIMQIVLKFMHW